MVKKKYVGRKANIRGVEGYVVEALTLDSKKDLLELLNKLMLDKKIKVYGLRHSDTDWSRPCTIEHRVFVNRFGWFITEEMSDSVLYDKKKKCIRDSIGLNSSNFYYIEDEEVNMFDILKDEEFDE